jgi:hypothetical protein
MNSLLLRILVLVSVVSTTGVASAQSRVPEKDVRTTQRSPIQADESYELDIKERRIGETNYKASQAVEVGSDDPKAMHVEVGVALTATTIDVLLRNVSGSVRFRGSVQRIVDVIKSRPLR